LKSLEFDGAAFDDLASWISHDLKKALKLISLIREVQHDPYQGTGQPERLKHDLVGCWSRRIDQEHRPAYQVFESESKTRIIACRYHY
jgi:toxin YoeB